MKQALCKDARMQDCKVFNSEQTDTLVRPKSGFSPTKPRVSCVPMVASVTLRDAERVGLKLHPVCKKRGEYVRSFTIFSYLCCVI